MADNNNNSNAKEEIAHEKIVLDDELNSQDTSAESSVQKNEDCVSKTKGTESPEMKISLKLHPQLLAVFVPLSILHVVYCTMFLWNEISHLYYLKKGEILHGVPMMVGVMDTLLFFRLLVQVVSGVQFLHGIYSSFEKMDHHASNFIFTGFIVTAELTLSLCFNIIRLALISTHPVDKSLNTMIFNYIFVNYFALVFYVCVLAYLVVYVSLYRYSLKRKQQIPSP